MALYLVSGGGGFIGSNIVARLVAEGRRVRVIDNFSTGRRENLIPFLDSIELYEGDICNLEAVSSVMDGVDYVLHQAALPSVLRSVDDPLTSHQVNANGTLNMLMAARDAKVKSFVMASSSSIYGADLALPKREAMCPAPISPYAINKLTAELYCQNFYQLFNLPTVCLRYFNVFGPNQDPASAYAAVIPKIIRALLADESPVIYGDGEQSRDFTYIDNVVNANLLATRSSAVGKVFNIGCGKRTSLNQLMDIIKKITGARKNGIYTEARLGDVRHSQADISKARECLGYHPLVDLEEGLGLTVDFLKKI